MSYRLSFHEVLVVWHLAFFDFIVSIVHYQVCSDAIMNDNQLYQFW